MSVRARALLAVLSGLLVVQAHIGVAALALVALTPLIVALMAPDPDGDPVPVREGVLLGALSTLVVGLHMYSVGEASFRTYAGAMGYMMVGGALFAAMALPMLRLSAGLRVAGIAAAWVLADATRTLGVVSFPSLLGATLADVPLLAQLGAVGGPWALDLQVALTSALVAQALHALLGAAPLRRVVAPAAVAVALVGTVTLGGAVRMSQDGLARPRPIRVAVPQGAVPAWAHRKAWQFEHLQQAIDAHYAALVARATHDPVDLVAIPESAFGKTFGPGADGVQQLTSLLPAAPADGTTFVAAITRLLDTADPEMGVHNREDTALALLFEAGRYRPLGAAAKRYLVPVLERRFRPAEDWHTIETPRVTLGTLICWESLYPGGGSKLAGDGAELLIVLTNDSVQRWGTGSRYHARLTKLRAIESGLPLVYASQAGPTFAVDPYGRTHEGIGLFAVGVSTFDIRSLPVKTLYNILGDGVLVLPALVWLLLLAAVWTRRGRRGHGTMPDSGDQTSKN